MPKDKKSLHIRSKIWIEDDSGEVIFGLGRLRILDAVSRNGSLQGAAKELKMSYRAVWGRIKATEVRLGSELLIRSAGGSSGGGSHLTPFAQTLVKQFRKLHRHVNDKSDAAFEKDIASCFKDF